MFDTYLGQTAKGWYSLLIKALKREEAEQIRCTTSAEEIRLLKAKLELTKNCIGTAKKKIERLEEAVLASKERERRTEVFGSTFFYCGEAEKDWFEEFNAKSKQLDAAKETIKGLSVGLTREKDDRMCCLDRIRDLVDTKCRLIDERDTSENRLTSCEAKLGESELKVERLSADFREARGRLCDYALENSYRYQGRTAKDFCRESTGLQEKLCKSEADLQLEKMKSAAKSLEIVNLNYALRLWPKLYAGLEKKFKYKGPIAKEWHGACQWLKNKDVQHVFTLKCLHTAEYLCKHCGQLKQDNTPCTGDGD